MVGYLAQPVPSVVEILRQNPRSARAFIRNHTACVGCYLGRFCTLNDVIAAYRLDAAVFLRDLGQVRPPQHESP
jgi:hypothetical protein